MFDVLAMPGLRDHVLVVYMYGKQQFSAERQCRNGVVPEGCPPQGAAGLCYTLTHHMAAASS